MSEWIDLTLENLDKEHLCCAISDKKHQCGVDGKRDWLRARLPEGHVFRKLDARGKVFIEYAPLETAWVPVLGENYLYIYCLWVAGAFQGRGHGTALLERCLADARAGGRSGVCVLSAAKKAPFLSDKRFFSRFGFQSVDASGGYELLALSFDGTLPRLTDRARAGAAESDALTIYHSPQCPFTANCVREAEAFCRANAVPLRLVPVDSLERAKDLPCVFNNWAVFYQGRFQSLRLLNENALKKLLGL